MKKMTKYRSNGIRVIKFNIGDNNYDKTMVFYKSGKPKQEKGNKADKIRRQIKKNVNLGFFPWEDQGAKLILELFSRRGSWCEN